MATYKGTVELRRSKVNTKRRVRLTGNVGYHPHVEVDTMRDWEESADVVLELDVAKILRNMGERAVANTSGKSAMAVGIVCRVVKRRVSNERVRTVPLGSSYEIVG